MLVKAWLSIPWIAVVAACELVTEPAVPPPVEVPADTRAPRLILWGPLVASQGGTLAVFFEVDEDVSELGLSVLGRTRRVYPMEDGKFRALVGVPIRTEPGEHPLTLWAVDRAGNEARGATTVDIEARSFPFVGRLRGLAGGTDDAERQAVRVERDDAFAEVVPTQLWSGPMAMPADGVVTSAFGAYREYPDGSRSYHDATDIARRRGVPVTAAASGRVRLARDQANHGNGIVLHHGQGVLTLYSHLETMEVAEGQPVTKGQRLGTMGATGRTTGPHLHFGVIVDGVPVDPAPWWEGTVPPSPTSWNEVPLSTPQPPPGR